MNESCVYHVGYRGGSGGFMLLHTLLLSTQYHSCDSEDRDLSKMINQQWNISTPSLWKTYEHWPDNFRTLTSTNNLKKILYFCNPDKEYFFNYQLDLFETFNKSYNNIKDSLWPNITSFNDFKNLPLRLQIEICNELDLASIINYVSSSKKYIWLYTDIKSQNELAFYKKAYWYHPTTHRNTKITDLSIFSARWQELQVDQPAVYFLEHSDILIRLQDLVNNPEILIKHQLLTDITQDQLDFINHWKNLHPPELLQAIGINISI
jgi:hypothetical protein